MSITQDRLKEEVWYDPLTGIFTRKKGSRAGKVGAIAGSLTSYGYIRVSICSKFYMAHRLAWLYVYGYLPENSIDHINGVRNDNRLANLQEVSRACNNAKSVRLPKKDGTPRCVSIKGAGFRFQTTVNGKAVIGPTRKTIEEAIIDRDIVWAARFNRHLVEEGCEIIVPEPV